MQLVEIFLPLNDNSGRPFGTEKYAAVREHLTESFGGLTAFSRSPAQGTTSDAGRRWTTRSSCSRLWRKPWTRRGGAATGSILSGCFARMRSWSVHRPSPCSEGPNEEAIYILPGGQRLHEGGDFAWNLPCEQAQGPVAFHPSAAGFAVEIYGPCRCEE